MSNLLDNLTDYELEQLTKKSEIDVLGLGESLALFDVKRVNKRIGVNDINEFYNVDYKVVVDRPSAFELNRIINIRNNENSIFLSQFDEWKPILSSPEKFIKIQPSYAGCVNSLLNPKCSITSVFVACCVAASLKPDVINLYGADFINHPHLSQDHKRSRILKDFVELKRELGYLNIKLKVYGDGILSII
jgi:hypothetical protein